MTPKEKALELLNKYLCIDDDVDLFCDECGMSEEAAKQCALIAVDEIMKLFYKDGGIDCFEYIYWAEVKNEIEKL